MAGRLPVEVVWLLGPDAVRRYQALDASSGPPACQALTDAGYVAMRDAWHQAGDHLLFDAGPHGAARCRWGHAHADALGVAVIARGRPLVVDPGTGSYTDGETRERLRSTFAHSTAWVDGLPQAEHGRTFEWLRPADARLERWLSTDEVALAEGTHDGYARAGLPFRHRRLVLYWKATGWLLRDAFEGSGRHTITLQFVLPVPPGDVTERPLGIELSAGSLGVLLSPSARNVTSSLIPFERSERYGSRSPGAAWRIDFEAELPALAVTVIRPDGPAPALRPAEGELDRFVDASCGDEFLVGAGEAVVSWKHRSTNATLVVLGDDVTLDGRPLPILESRTR